MCREGRLGTAHMPGPHKPGAQGAASHALPCLPSKRMPGVTHAVPHGRAGTCCFVFMCRKWRQGGARS